MRRRKVVFFQFQFFFCIVESARGHCTSVLDWICFLEFFVFSSLHSFVLRRVSRAIFPHAFFIILIVLPLGLYTAAREISADNYLQGLFYVLKRRIIMYK